MIYQIDITFIDGDCVLHSRFIESHIHRKHKNHILAGRRVKLNKELTAGITKNDIIEKRIENPDFWKQNCSRDSIKYGYYNSFQYHLRNIIHSKVEFIGCNFFLSIKMIFSLLMVMMNGLLPVGLKIIIYAIA